MFGEDRRFMSKRAWVFLSFVCLTGLLIILYGVWTWRADNISKFIVYCLVALLASRLRVSLPEITGTISVSFLFILVGIVELNFSETLFLGCAAILAQCFGTRRKWPRLEQAAFNVG